MPITEGPWKLVAAGNVWGIARAKAPRGEDDICGGSQYHDDWKANAKAIAALPDLIEALRAVSAHAGVGEPLKGQIAAALKKAGG